MMDELRNVINFLSTHYLDINKLWINNTNYEKFNLKKSLVKDVYSKDNIIKVIREYQSFLLEATVKLNFVLDDKYNVISRVKTSNSIEDKIHRYNSINHEEGKIPICKCLNDLFGARIVINESLDYYKISEFLEEKIFFDNTNVKLKCIDSSKNGYNATHVYFAKERDNSVFQWELQIWSIEDVYNNVESHSRYKQNYTKWENEMINKGE